MTTTQPPENRQATIERGTGISWDAWGSFIGTTPTINGESLTCDPRISSTEKWRYWCASLTDGTEITASFQTKKTPAGSSTKGIVSVDRTKLTGAELIVPTKTWWKNKLGEFAATL